MSNKHKRVSRETAEALFHIGYRIYVRRHSWRRRFGKPTEGVDNRWLRTRLDITPGELSQVLEHTHLYVEAERKDG